MPTWSGTMNGKILDRVRRVIGIVTGGAGSDARRSDLPTPDRWSVTRAGPESRKSNTLISMRSACSRGAGTSARRKKDHDEPVRRAKAPPAGRELPHDRGGCVREVPGPGQTGCSDPHRDVRGHDPRWPEP